MMKTLSACCDAQPIGLTTLCSDFHEQADFYNEAEFLGEWPIDAMDKEEL